MGSFVLVGEFCAASIWEVLAPCNRGSSWFRSSEFWGFQWQTLAEILSLCRFLGWVGRILLRIWAEILRKTLATGASALQCTPGTGSDWCNHSCAKHFFGKTWQSCEEPCHQKFRTHRLTKGMGSCYRMAKWTMSTYLGASRRQSITASFEQSWQGQGWSHSSHSETKSPLLTPTCWNSFQSLEN